MTRRNGKPKLAPATAAPRAAFYCRVSSEDQQERGTIESQRSYLQDRYRVDLRDDAPPETRMTFAGEYIDDGVSGAIALDKRPAGQRLLADARAGLIDVVVFYKLDRLGRTARVLLDAHDELETYGVAILSATEPFDTRPGPSQAIGVFVFQLLGSIAQLERSTIRTRTMDGKRRVAREGRFVNGTLTYGYDVDDDERMVPSQRMVGALGMTESDLIRTLYERVAGGESCYALSDWLTKAGVPAPRYMFNKELRRVTEVHIAPTWSNKRIWQAIRNPVYRGNRTLHFEGDAIEQQVVPLVSEELWQTANLRMADSNPWNRSGRRDSDKDYIYIASKKLRCSGKLADGQDCGLFYTGGLANAIRYYRCNGNDVSAGRRRGSRCHSKMIRAEAVEATLWQDIVWVIEHPDAVLAQLRGALASRNDASSTFRTRQAVLLEQRERLQDARQAVRRRATRGLLNQAEVDEDLEATAQQLAAVDQQLAEVAAVLDGDDQHERRLTDTATMLERMRSRIAEVEAVQDRAAMREIINALIDEVEVLPGPQLAVRYTFSDTRTVESLVNVKTVLVFSDQPQDRVRVLC